MRIAPAFNTIWSDRLWTLLAMTWDINWNNGGRQSINVVGEVGYRVAGGWNIFAGPGVGVVGRAPTFGIDWTVIAGVRWVFTSPIFSQTIFDMPLGK
jgi:hypothetical protein